MASCKLDGELTEFEQSGLERHCAGCADCSAWTRELGHIVDALRTSERVEPREILVARSLRHGPRRLPALVAASASMGAAFLAVIAIALPGRGGLIGEQALTENPRHVSIADPPPRSLVLVSLLRAQQTAPGGVARRRPYGAP